MTVFITGDTHCPIDIKKLNSKNFPQGKNLTKDDYVIICGDFGGVWDGKRSDEWWLKWLDKKPWTTLFVDGNHENFNLLEKYPEEEWRGGKIHKIKSSIIHLMRGYIYDIPNLGSVFTFGGGFSHDIKYRVKNITWWEEELPTKIETERALDNLKKRDFKVDYIITHDVPRIILNNVLNYSNSDYEIQMRNYGEDKINIQNFFNTIYKITNFKRWFAGHYHINLIDKNYKIQILYNDIITKKEGNEKWIKIN